MNAELILMPPPDPKAGPVETWIAKEWVEKDAISFDPIIVEAVDRGVEDADLFDRIELHGFYDEDETEREGVLNAWYDAGKYVAAHLMSMFHKIDFNQVNEANRETYKKRIEEFVNDNLDSLMERAWFALQALDEMDSFCRRSKKWDAQFYRGFEAGASAWQETIADALENRKGKRKERKEVYAYSIRIYLNVRGMNIDYSGPLPMLAFPSLADVWETLRGWIERDGVAVPLSFKAGVRDLRIDIDGKFSGEVLFDVNLDGGVNWDGMDKILENIRNDKVFFGGQIETASVTPAKGRQAFSYKGFAAIADGELVVEEDEPQIGFIHTGWRVEPDAHGDKNTSPFFIDGCWVNWNSHDASWWVTVGSDDFIGVESD